MVRFFEFEDIPFTAEFSNEFPNIIESDSEGRRVWRIMPDKSLKRASGPRVSVWLRRRREISSGEAMRLVPMWERVPPSKDEDDEWD